MNLKLIKTQTIITIGPMELDKQDILIFFGMISIYVFVVILLMIVGISEFFLDFIGPIIIGIIFRNILISKGHLKVKK